MLGAIIGDIVGSSYEYFRNAKEGFPLFDRRSHFTDDTVMTVAIADANINARESYFDKTYTDYLKGLCINAMRTYGHKYPNKDYGCNFKRWLEGSFGPYGSLGNGSAMRVSSVGWLYPSLEITQMMAKSTAEVTHNHPEGIKGAQAVASAIYMARTHKSKKEIKEYIEKTFGYNLTRNYEEIRYEYQYSEACPKCIPESLICFLKSDSFEDAIRKAVMLNGDTDTMAAITGSIAEAYYGIPKRLKRKAMRKLDIRLRMKVKKYYRRLKWKKIL